jgi:DNA (cytosine-5)-methyltransferase 1
MRTRRRKGLIELLVLSLFPGIGLLDMAFELEGFCVVRGPDLLWGGDVRRFHPPAGKFDGVIGGPPCQRFSRMANIARAMWGEESLAPNLIPEYERCVAEAAPSWFLMENVPAAPAPVVDGYQVSALLYNNRWAPEAPEQNRERLFCFGTAAGVRLHPNGCALQNQSWERAVVAQSSKEGALAKSQGELAGRVSARLQRRASVLPGQTPRRSFERCCELQGLPADFLADSPFTSAGKYQAVGNGVPLPMGRAIARAVRQATERREATA